MTTQALSENYPHVQIEHYLDGTHHPDVSVGKRVPKATLETLVWDKIVLSES